MAHRATDMVMGTVRSNVREIYKAVDATRVQPFGGRNSGFGQQAHGVSKPFDKKAISES